MSAVFIMSQKSSGADSNPFNSLKYHVSINIRDVSNVYAFKARIKVHAQSLFSLSDIYYQNLPNFVENLNI